MFYKTLITTVAIAWTTLSFAQKNNQHALATYPDSIAPVGIIRNIPDSELLDIVQRQTFRYFWHFGHPVSGLARERDNTVKAEYYWDFINEAENEPNFSKNSFGPEACAIAGPRFGILSTSVALQRGSTNKNTPTKPLRHIAT